VSSLHRVGEVTLDEGKVLVHDKGGVGGLSVPTLAVFVKDRWR